MKLLFGYILLVNLAAFILYGADKRKAIRGQWRIPERTLLGAAFLGGSIGALLGMQVFRHKTRHWKFRICVPLFLLLHVLILGLLVGAYHFFSFDSAPETQAELYIRTVGDLDGRLLPVVDVEYYGDKEVNPPEAGQVHTSLRSFLEVLEHQYQVKPMIYTTYKVYHRYLKHEFDEYPLWIRNVYYEPWMDLNRRWTLWQYTDRAVLDGYQGLETHIDLNVFHGTREELQKLVVGEEQQVS